MKFISKSLYRANTVFVFKDVLPHPDADLVFALYRGRAADGASFVDDVVMNVKIFNFPAMKLKIVFDNNRLRIDDESQKDPEETRRGSEAYRIKNQFFANLPISAFGFNFDVIYRMNDVIPQREIMKNFIDPVKIENIKDFGCQFSLIENDGQRLCGYFLKITSPLELTVHFNYHFDQTPLPSEEKFQELLNGAYQKIDELFKYLSF